MTSSLFPRCHRPPPGTGTGTGAGAGKGALGGREGRARRCPEGAERGPAAAGGGGVSAARLGEVGTAAARERVGGERWGVAAAPRGWGRGSGESRRCRRLRCRSPVSSEQFGLRPPRRRGCGAAERGWMRTGRPGGRGCPRASPCERASSDWGEPLLLQPRRGDGGQLGGRCPAVTGPHRGAALRARHGPSCAGRRPRSRLSRPRSRLSRLSRLSRRKRCRRSPNFVKRCCEMQFSGCAVTHAASEAFGGR